MNILYTRRVIYVTKESLSWFLCADSFIPRVQSERLFIDAVKEWYHHGIKQSPCHPSQVETQLKMAEDLDTTQGNSRMGH